MMIGDDAPLGCSGLLRVAGLPIRYWLAGANSALFRKVERLDDEDDARRIDGIHLAERIGQELVPNSAVTRDDRAFLLAVRRALHRGALIETTPRERLLAISGLPGVDAELVQSLLAIIELGRSNALLSAEIEAELAREQERLLLLPEQIRDESSIASALLAPRDADGSGIGPHHSRKSRRHRGEHEWRRIARAATGSTPRGWLSHIALLSIDAATQVLPAVTEEFTAQWMENIRARRLALADPPEDWPAPESRLALNPLHWIGDGQFVCLVLDESKEQTQLSVRNTSLLNAICEALTNGSRTFGELSLALGCEAHDDRLTLRGFVRHLVVLGILQPSAAPLVRLERRATPGQTFAHLTTNDTDHAGWVDIYRYAETGISLCLAQEIEQGVSQALRVLSLKKSEPLNLDQWSDLTPTRSWSLTEILRVELDNSETPTPKYEEMDPTDARSVSATSPSGYTRLAGAIAERAGHGGEVVIDSDLLDECGAENGLLNWPVDCLVRVPAPGAGFTAVLDQLWPPAMLDARFIDTLADMHGAIPHVEIYRAFLRQVEQLTGILLVELFLPPLTDGAANAVRRPLYTSAWTGDPHAEAYLRGDTDPGRYIPLDAIQVRRIDGRLRAEVDGQPIWPVYHATRSFSPPWDRLARLLLATAPLELPWDFNRMIRSLTQLPGHIAVPRVSVSGGIVLSPAQWRVSPDHLWDKDTTTSSKLRTLVRLRHRYSLPRWVYLDRGDVNPPVACDLESIHAIRTIERYATDRTPMNVIEMLPTPEQFIVIDGAHRNGDRLAAQFHLRFPCDESATALAIRIAPAILAALGSPRPATTGCRGPPSSRDH